MISSVWRGAESAGREARVCHTAACPFGKLTTDASGRKNKSQNEGPFDTTQRLAASIQSINGH